MSSRQSSVALSVSQNGLQYAAPASFAVAQNDILYTNETSNPVNGGAVNGTGSSAVQTQLLPILTSSGSIHGLTSSSTTATCTLGSPHGFANSASTVLVTVVANNPSYNVTASACVITGPYSFTYTTSGSNLPVSDGGTVTTTVPAWTATQSANQGYNPIPVATALGTTGQPFSNAIQGATINGSTVGTLEFWGDGTLWDTTNNRSIPFVQGIDPAVQYKSK